MVEAAYALSKTKKLSGLRQKTHEFTNGRRHLWDLQNAIISDFRACIRQASYAGNCSCIWELTNFSQRQNAVGSECVVLRG